MRTDERGTTIVFADRFTPEAERQRAAREGETPGVIPFLKRFTVFYAAQCDGLPAELTVAAPPVQTDLILPRAAALIAATATALRIGGDRPFYGPVEDYVPAPEAFFEPVNWHRTVFHELGHWSGHASRLARDLAGRMGSASCAREELMAEMAGAFVCAALGIVPTVRHADYLGEWLTVLPEDNRVIIRAASAASKAADYLLAFGASQGGAPEEEEG